VPLRIAHLPSRKRRRANRRSAQRNFQTATSYEKFNDVGSVSEGSRRIFPAMAIHVKAETNIYL
jgi:hypothetical protein